MLVALLVLFGAGADLIMWLIGLRSTYDPLPGESLVPAVGTILTVAGAGGLAWAAGYSKIPTKALLYAALVFEILICLAISLGNPLSFYEDTGAVPLLTWVTPVIIFFPLVVPYPPAVTLVAAILAALTRPAGLFWLSSSGLITVTSEDYLSCSFGPAIGVVIAYFASKTVHGLGVQVAEARRMGSYKLVRLLGQGGMGEVWEAEHHMLARPAAVKLIRPELLGPAGPERDRTLKRFAREAQATSMMRSQHTVNLYDFGMSPDGTFFYVMELLEGMNAEALVKKFGPLPAARAVYLLRQACHSLNEAHQEGIVHRDIKPANIYVCRYGLEEDFVKVLDFGLVKASRKAAPTDATQTMENRISGTPAYMSPEQAMGTDRNNPLSDIYALGCVAYWLLTGRLVFEGATPLEVLVQHANREPFPPSQQTELPVPEKLDQVILACLKKDMEQRPRSALELSEQLEQSLAGHSEPWTPALAHQWWDQNMPARVTPCHQPPVMAEMEQRASS